VKCPYCPVEQTLNDAKQIFFWAVRRLRERTGQFVWMWIFTHSQGDDIISQRAIHI